MKGLKRLNMSRLEMEIGSLEECTCILSGIDFLILLSESSQQEIAEWACLSWIFQG